MSAEEKIIERILSARVSGIKKTDLRKEYGEETDAILENLINQGHIVIDKKGTAHYLWHKDFYFQSLLNSDPKLKITFEAIKSLQQSVDNALDRLKNIETTTSDISTKVKLTIEESEQNNSDKISLEFDQFRNEFDTAIANHSSSIGWVEIAKIRSELCNKYNISDKRFYSLMDELTNQYHDRYELSTGGYEGLTVRGLVHGFVRCI